MKTTILGGLLFLVPLAGLAIILSKAYDLSTIVVRPIDRIIPIETIAGAALVNILAVVLIVLVCYGAGIVAKRRFLSARMEVLEGLLIDVVPAYVVIKGTIGSVASPEKAADFLKPVMVRFDDYDQIAFEIEADATRSVVFLPGAPSAWSGATVFVEKSRVHPIDLPAHQAVKLMRVMGRGSLPYHASANMPG